MKAEATGFKALEQSDLKLDANQVMNQGTLTLQVGQNTEVVTVQAEVPLVETSTAQKSFVISSRQVTEMSRAARPDGWGAYFYLGRAKLQQDKVGEAVVLLERAVKLNPEDLRRSINSRGPCSRGS